MAAGGFEDSIDHSVPGPFEFSADFTIYNSDFCCTPCLAETKEIPAEVYCQDCEEFFCEVCSFQHSRFRQFRSHVALDKSTFDERGRKPKTQMTPTSKCMVLNHYGALMTVYCETHRVHCCPNCAILEHEKCKTNFIPEVAKGIAKSKCLHDVISCFQDYQNHYTEMKVTLATERHEMQLEKDKIADWMAEFKKKVYMSLENLQESSTKDLEEKYRVQDLHLAREIGKIGQRLDSIEKFLEETGKLKQSECELYVKYMNGRYLSQELEKDIQAMARRRKRPSVKFSFNRKLERMFDGVISLGSVSVNRD